MSSEIPGEPLPAHGAVLHAIEWMLVYVVWENNFNYKIVPLRIRHSSFIDSICRNNILKESNLKKYNLLKNIIKFILPVFIYNTLKN